MSGTAAQSYRATIVGAGKSILTTLLVCSLAACGGGSSNGINTGNAGTDGETGVNVTVSLKSVEVTPRILSLQPALRFR